MRTYYEVIDQETGRPAAWAQQAKLGTPAYGYKTLKMAQSYCYPGQVVRERHSEGGNDWAGEIVAHGEAVRRRNTAREMRARQRRLLAQAHAGG